MSSFYIKTVFEPLFLYTVVKLNWDSVGFCLERMIKHFLRSVKLFSLNSNTIAGLQMASLLRQTSVFRECEVQNQYNTSISARIYYFHEKFRRRKYKWLRGCSRGLMSSVFISQHIWGLRRRSVSSFLFLLLTECNLIKFKINKWCIHPVSTHLTCWRKQM